MISAMRKLPGLKPKDQINRADERQRAFAHPETLEPIAFDQHYADVESITLSTTTPFEVIEAFDRARNAWLYSRFVYELSSLAEMQAYATLEMALRIRLGIKGGKRTPGLSKLLEMAIEQGLIIDPQAHLKGGIAFTISKLRNIWQHGTDNLLTPSMALETIQLSAQLINQLFPSI
jgi:hypothetical protein